MKTNILTLSGIFALICLSFNSSAQNTNTLNKEALKGKVWCGVKGNPKKIGSQTYSEGGVFTNGGAMMKGKWSWKNDSVLDLKFSGVSWEQTVKKLTDTEYVMEWKGVTYTLTPKQ